MSEMIERVARAMFEAENAQPNEFRWSHTCANYRLLARAAIKSMRPEFEKLSGAYSPQEDDCIWIDERTPIGQFIDSIINDLALEEEG